MNKLTVLILYLLFSSASLAQIPCDYAPPVLTTEELWDNLIVNLDTCRRQRVSAELDQMLLSVGMEDRSDVAIQTVLVWQVLANDFASAGNGQSVPELKNLYGELAARADIAAEGVLAGHSSPAYDVALKQAWEVNFHGRLGQVLDNDEQALTAAIELKDILEQACHNEGEPCSDTYNTGDAILTKVMLASTVGAQLGKPVILGLAKKVSEVNADWDRFLFDSKPMYPWDLIATDLLNRSWGGYSEQSGLLEPPATQYFVLHPAPGFGYVGNADDGHQLKPTAYIELVGVNQWRRKYLTGVSVIMEYSDRSGAEDVGYGGLFTFANKYQLGVTWRDGDVGFTVGIDLANLYREQLKQRIDKIRAHTN